MHTVEGVIRCGALAKMGTEAVEENFAMMLPLWEYGLRKEWYSTTFQLRTAGSATSELALGWPVSESLRSWKAFALELHWYAGS